MKRFKTTRPIRPRETINRARNVDLPSSKQLERSSRGFRSVSSILVHHGRYTQITQRDSLKGLQEQFAALEKRIAREKMRLAKDLRRRPERAKRRAALISELEERALLIVDLIVKRGGVIRQEL